MLIWKDPTYHLVTTKDQLKKLAKILKHTIDINQPISIDVETTGAIPSSGLDSRHGWLLGLNFCVDKDEGYYIPVGHTKNGKLRKYQLSLEQVKEILTPILSSGGMYIAHNAKFDYKFLWRAGIPIFPNFWCTMIAAKLLNGDVRKRVALKLLIKKYVEMPSSVIQSFEEASQGNAAETNPIDFCTYAVNDTIFAYYLYEVFKPKIDKQYYKLFYNGEAPLIPLLAQMEMRGIKIDKAYYKSIRKPLEDSANKIKKLFLDKHKLNISSPLQLGTRMDKLFPKFKFEKTKTGNTKTDVEALQKILRMTHVLEPAHVFAKQVLLFRGTNKALSTYIDKYPSICHDYYSNGHVESILHTQFDQIKNSGRMSSSPNIQNITRDNEIVSIRRGFVARNNMVFVEADWKGMELRLVAIDSKDARMIRAFTDSPRNADLHTITAQGIFKKQNIDDDERHIGKTINFSILYGATEFSISKTLNCTRDKATEYLDLFYETYPGIAKWKQRISKKVRDYGFSETFYGRKRYMPFDVFPSMREQYRYHAAIRELTNHIIQGTSADLLKFAMVALSKEFAKQKLNAYLLTTTHDSIIVETTEPEQVSDIMKKIMEVTISDILLPIDINVKPTFAKE